MNDTNFGRESIKDIRIVEKDNKTIYEEKKIVDGKEVWSVVKTVVDEIVAKEFEPHTEQFSPSQNPISDLIAKTAFIPHDFKGVNTDVLIKKTIEDMKKTTHVDRELLQNYMDRLIKLHAILIRITGVTPETILAGNATQLDKLRKNSALREAVLLIIDVVGDPWDKVKDKI